MVSGRLLCVSLAGGTLITSLSAQAALRSGETVVPLPSGNGRIAFVSARTGDQEVFAIQLDGSDQQNLTNSPLSAEITPSYSPDGKKIAFSSDRTGLNQVFSMNEDGTNQTNVSNDPGYSDSQPSFSPGGSKIVFTRRSSLGEQEIYIMNVDGTQKVNLSNDPGFADSDPVFSPNGAKIAFTTDRTGDAEVFMMNVDGSGQTNLSNDPGFADRDPAFSPEGSMIGFTTDRTGDEEIYLMNIDGSGQTNLSNDPGFADRDPAFSPNEGTRIALTSDRSNNPNIALLNVTPAGGSFGRLINVTVAGAADSQATWQPLLARAPLSSPIEHVVIIDMENHSFDNVLGYLCVQDVRCDGATSGELYDGSTIALAQADDVVPDIPHDGTSQRIAVNGGLMNGFSRLQGCRAADNYVCYSQFHPEQIPTLAGLARQFTISDRTFESSLIGSFGSHVELVASILDGFTKGGIIHIGVGWGCDSGRDQLWYSSAFARGEFVPTCIPQKDGSGPYRPSTVPWVGTIMDRLDQAGLTWGLYTPRKSDAGYNWAVCPVFAECLYTSQNLGHTSPKRFAPDAAAGDLPNVSILIPVAWDSQHNHRSMLMGDNWLAEMVNAAMNGPDWNTTAIFITYDDCGCFYDHVPPPKGLGIRVPMVIVSPYAKAAYTDSTMASYASMLAFIEHAFSLAPLASDDANAYDYAGSFDFGQRPLPPRTYPVHAVPASVIRWMRSHPLDPDEVT